MLVGKPIVVKTMFFLKFEEIILVNLKKSNLFLIVMEHVKKEIKRRMINCGLKFHLN